MSFDIQKQMQDNLANFYLTMKHKKVEIKDMQGDCYSGYAETVAPTQKTILLQNIKQQNQQSKQIDLKFKLWQFSELAYLKINHTQNSNDSNDQKFKIDGETIANRNNERKEKTLVRWTQDQGMDQADSSLDQNQKNNFDQFQANLEMFGVLATYDENSYTTELRLNNVDDGLKSYANQQMNFLINQSGTEKNRHILEERNLKVLQDNNENNGVDEDEEAQYSAVLGSGSYKDYSTGQEKQQLEQKKKSKGKQNNRAQQQSKPTFTSKEDQIVQNNDLNLLFNQEVSMNVVRFFNSKLVSNENNNQQKPYMLRRTYQESNVQFINEVQKQISLKDLQVIPIKGEKFKLGLQIKDEKKLQKFNSLCIGDYKEAKEYFNIQKLLPDWQKNKLDKIKSATQEFQFPILPIPAPLKNLEKQNSKSQTSFQDFNLSQLDPQNIAKELQPIGSKPHLNGQRLQGNKMKLLSPSIPNNQPSYTQPKQNSNQFPFHPNQNQKIEWMGQYYQNDHNNQNYGQFNQQYYGQQYYNPSKPNELQSNFNSQLIPTFPGDFNQLPPPQK